METHMTRDYRAELAEFGWEFDEEGGALISELERCIDQCDYKPAKWLMEDWLLEL